MSDGGKRSWRRRWKALGWLAAIWVVLLGVRVVVGWRWERISVGYETTRVSGPLNGDGTVNYMRAINERNAAGVTNESNAAVGVMKALGPEFMPAWMGERAEKEWGMPKAEAGRKFFVTFEQYMEKRAGKGAGREEEQKRYWAWGDRLKERRTKGWRSADDPEMAEWLKENEAALAVAVEASGREKWFLPLMQKRQVEGVFEALVPSLGRMRALADTLLARGVLCASEGDRAGCERDLLAVHRLGRLEMQAPMAIEVLVGIAMVSAAAQADVVVARGGISADAARGMIGDREALPELPAYQRCLDQYERFAALDQLTRVKRFGPDADFEAGTPRPAGMFAFGMMPVRFDPVMRESNMWTDRIVAAAGVEPWPAKVAALRAVMADLDAAAPKMGSMRGSQEALRMLGLIMIAGRDVVREFGHSERARVEVELGVVALALAGYKAEHGAYPERLEELSPGFLAKVPADRFAGRALTYRREGKGYLVYSVGPNMVDEDGVKGDRKKDPRDLRDDVAVRGE